MGGRVKFIRPMSSSSHISRRSVKPLLRYCDLNGGSPPSWIFEIRHFNRITTTSKRYCAKFHADRSNQCGGMAFFRLLKMAVVRHLGFLKVRNFTCRSASEGQCASLYQSSHRSAKPFWRYGQFSIFQDGGRPPS